MYLILSFISFHVMIDINVSGESPADRSEWGSNKLNLFHQYMLIQDNVFHT